MINLDLQQTEITRTVVAITVTGGPGNIRDYVALYHAGAASWFDWLYVATGTKLRALKGKIDGTVKFVLANKGRYEAKCFSLTDQGVATLLKSATFSVGMPPEGPSYGQGVYGKGIYGTG